MKKNYDDLIGQTFNRLTILEIFTVKQGKYYRTMAKCQCTCGNIITTRLEHLKNGRAKSCGCYHREVVHNTFYGKINDLTGETFGRLVVLKTFRENNRTYCECQCSCGNITIIEQSCLKSGKTRSCGCLQSEISKECHTKHGKSQIRMCHVWSSMKQRCYSTNNKKYKNYGARGITVCDEWKNDFKAFYDWATQNGYDENAKYGECTIDRIDVNGNYCPENCRFTTLEVQMNNKTKNNTLEINGTTKTMSEWSKFYNINYSTVRTRINRGWNKLEALTTTVTGENNNGRG